MFRVSRSCSIAPPVSSAQKKTLRIVGIVTVLMLALVVGVVVAAASSTTSTVQATDTSSVTPEVTADFAAGWSAAPVTVTLRTFQWSSRDLGMGYRVHLERLGFVDADHGWALGTNMDTGHRVILATTDGGVTWSEQQPGILITDVFLSDIAFADAKHGWAVGYYTDKMVDSDNYEAVILATTDGGATWSEQDSGSNPDLYDVTFVDDQHGWAVGGSWSTSGDSYQPVILVTDNGGTTWSRQPVGDSKLWYGDLLLRAVTFSDVNHGWAVGSSNGDLQGVILATSNGGATWSAQLVKPPVTSFSRVVSTDANHCWAMGWTWWDEPLIEATTDGGKTWSVSLSGNPEVQNGQVTGLSDIAFADNNHGWAVGRACNSTTGAYTGVVLATADGGTTWSEQVSGSSAAGNAYPYRVACASAGDVWAVGDGATILATADDSSGVAKTQYRLNSPSDPKWHTTTANQFVVPAPSDHSNDGVHAYRCRAVDNAGNSGPIDIFAVKIDTTGPTVTNNAPGAWKKTAVTVNLTAKDGNSGVAKTQYRLASSSTWLDTTANQFVVAAPADHSNDGTNSYEYRAIDNAGNVSSTGTCTVRIDTTKPTATDDAPASWSDSDVTVTITALDAGSGAGLIQYRLSSSADPAWHDCKVDDTHGQFIVSALEDHSNDGVHVYRYRVLDNIGNISDTGMCTVRISTL